VKAIKSLSIEQVEAVEEREEKGSLKYENHEKGVID